MPTFVQNQRTTRRLRTPNSRLCFQIRGEVQRGAAPGSGSKAPAGAASSPARKARQASKSAAIQAGHRPGSSDQGEGLVGRPLAAAGHADQLLAEDVERARRSAGAARSGPPGRPRP